MEHPSVEHLGEAGAQRPCRHVVGEARRVRRRDDHVRAAAAAEHHLHDAAGVGDVAFDDVEPCAGGVDAAVDAVEDRHPGRRRQTRLQAEASEDGGEIGGTLTDPAAVGDRPHARYS